MSDTNAEHRLQRARKKTSAYQAACHERLICISTIYNGSLINQAKLLLLAEFSGYLQDIKNELDGLVE